jgi:ribonuclease P protein component
MTSRDGEGFPRAARIRRRREFLSLGRTGQKRRTEHFVLLLQRAAGGSPRLGVTVSRKVGGAVTRNRLKRRIREAFRRHEARADFEYDVVVIAKPGSEAATVPSISRTFSDAVVMRGTPRRSTSQR